METLARRSSLAFAPRVLAWTLMRVRQPPPGTAAVNVGPKTTLVMASVMTTTTIVAAIGMKVIAAVNRKLDIFGCRPVCFFSPPKLFCLVHSPTKRLSRLRHLPVGGKASNTTIATIANVWILKCKRAAWARAGRRISLGMVFATIPTTNVVATGTMVTAVVIRAKASSILIAKLARVLTQTLRACARALADLAHTSEMVSATITTTTVAATGTKAIAVGIRGKRSNIAFAMPVRALIQRSKKS